MAKLLGQCSSTASSWACLTVKHKHRVFPSQLQTLWASTGLLEENMLPLLLYWLSSTVKKVLLHCRYRAATNHIFFHVKWNFWWNWREVIANQSCTHLLAQSCNHSLVSETLSKSDIGTKQRFPNWILCKLASKAADLSPQPVLGKGVCSDSNQTVWRIQMAEHKSLEMMSWMTVNG